MANKYKVTSPNKEYTGISAGVLFNRGEGETSDEWLATWFESKGYTVEVIKEYQEEEIPKIEEETQLKKAKK